MRALWIGVLVLVFGLSQSSYAQLGEISRKPQIEVFGGLAIPLAPQEFKDYYKVGYSLHGQYVMFPSTKLGVSFTAAYEEFTFDQQKFLDDMRRADPFTDYSGFSVDGSASVLELGAGVRPYLTSPEANNQIFLFGMLTYNFLSTEAKVLYHGVSVGTTKDDENKFGIAIGPGMEMPLNESMNLIVQGVYRYIFTTDEATSFLGITSGLVF